MSKNNIKITNIIIDELSLYLSLFVLDNVYILIVFKYILLLNNL